MGLQKDIAINGIIFSYWKLGHYNILHDYTDSANSSLETHLWGWTTKAIRDDPSKPKYMVSKRYLFEGADFPNIEQVEKIRIIIYNKLKTLEEWQGAIDV